MRFICQKFNKKTLKKLYFLVRTCANIWVKSKRVFYQGLIIQGKIFVCVTEQHYVSILFTRLWSLRSDLISDTQNLKISRLFTAHAYKIKTKRQAKWSEDEKNDTSQSPVYLKSIALRTGYKQVKKIVATQSHVFQKYNTEY